MGTDCVEEGAPARQWKKRKRDMDRRVDRAGERAQDLAADVLKPVIRKTIRARATGGDCVHTTR